jgi:hypothetical protein
MTMKAPNNREGPPSSPRSSGFQAQIKGASLSDLVQMECLAGSRRVVRVTSGANIGFLYFRGGGLVHAVARTLTGEAAALDMLSWNEGSFEPVERDWPSKDTITSGWQSLIIRAAQIRDERQAPSVVALRTDARTPKTPAAQPAVETIEFDATPFEVAGHVLRSEDFELVLRLNAGGDITVNHGASQDFADTVAYACRLTELIGAQLGVERFRAMECVFKSGRCFIVLERDGDVIALRPRSTTDCAELRELLGV